MKKCLGLLVIIFMILYNTSYAKSCKVTNGTISYSVNQTIPSEINYQSGLGYCKKSINPGGIILDLTKCENVDDIRVGGNYLIAIQFESEGFEFLEPSNDATPINYSISIYSTMDDLCNNENGIDISMTYHYGPEQNQLISNDSTELMQANHPYFLVEIPSFKYNKNEIDLNSDVYIKIGIIDADAICVVCNNAICSDTYDIGKISCFDSYSLIFPYAIVSQENNNWWTGLAITNLSRNEGQFKIFLHTQSNVYVFTKDINGNEVSTFTIDSLMDNKDYQGNCWIQVDSNFPMNGICFFGNDIGHSCYLGVK